MRVLINQITPGLSAHIADAQGQPLCNTRLKLTNWRLGDRKSTAITVCHSCLRAQAKADAAF